VSRLIVTLGVVVGLALTTRAEAKGCREISAVVGLQRCGRFGTWSRDAAVPAVRLELGAARQTYLTAPFAFGGAQASTTALPTRDLGLAVRVLYGFADVLDVGAELRFGQSSVTGLSGPVAAAAVTNLGGHAIVGAHVALWRTSVGVELAGGGRWQTFASCTTRGCHPTTASDTTRELEVRGRADLFVTPQLSLGLLVGKSLLTPDEHVAMLTVGFHARALDGMP
jgi:hypothetical protein